MEIGGIRWLEVDTHSDATMLSATFVAGAGGGVGVGGCLSASVP